MTSLDELARVAAREARAEAEVLAGPVDQRALRTAPFEPPADRRRHVVTLAAAALVIAVVGAVTWVSVGRDATTNNTIGGTTPTPVAPAPTTPATNPAPTTTGAPTTPTAGVVDSSPSRPTVPSGAVSPGGEVSYLDPPGVVALETIATVGLRSDPSTAPPPVAVLLDGGVAAVDNGRRVIVVVDPDGVSRDVALVGDSAPSSLSEVAAGPDGLLYGLDPGSMGRGRIVGLSLDGDDAGHVQTSVDIDVNSGFVEPPQGGVLRAGPTGIIDGLTGEELIQYPNRQVYGLDTLRAGRDDSGNAEDTIVRADGSIAWAFDIERIATEMHSYSGDAPPAATADGGGRYWTAIGPYEQTGSDFPPATMPVIAFLQPDGAVTWQSLPTGWLVGSSGIAGTVLLRWEPDHVTLALAAPTTTPPDGINLATGTLRGVSIGEHTPEDAIATAPAQLQPLALDSGWFLTAPRADGEPDCLADREQRVIWWGDESMAFVRDGDGTTRLWSWTVGDVRASGWGDRRQPNPPQPRIQLGAVSTAGIGLGSSVDELVAAHGGTIAMSDSPEPDGTRVGQWFPDNANPGNYFYGLAVNVDGRIIGIGATQAFC